MASCVQKRRYVETIPKAKDIVDRGWCKPPEYVIEKMADETTWLIGVDIETNDWEVSRGNKGSIGKFGFYNLCNPSDLEARIVQLGWSFGPPGGDATIKEFLVCPEGFEISEKATQYHGISNELATTQGISLKDALREFMNDIAHVIGTQKGRMVCHHLEFDAGIIANEMNRCGMFKLMDTFEDYARRGLCTMDRDIGRWLMQCYGQDVGPNTSMNVLSLKKIVELALPEEKHLLEKHHSAGADSLLVRKLAYALWRLSKNEACNVPAEKNKDT